ncbi:DotU family type IV/VI secretion system protein [Marinibactrum halimedae]|uniref:Type IV / VI secretion system DotU domain-containing protein n=1 Tax=Marinibactrum halimedae TaxID=1444977 RepID=A0AA37T173_9GAMM|nr:DotU family type IV/VI secretion system protein [Marinibactrum halimedae]MCD9458101.1 DotU family type IV/VI secretion system protein [Marinibactrum halimedae]GLS25035.1 hypothetical protein GCM10007877_07490 [Marinibactrum halimedae]
MKIQEWGIVYNYFCRLKKLRLLADEKKIAHVGRVGATDSMGEAETANLVLSKNKSGEKSKSASNSYEFIEQELLSELSRCEADLRELKEKPIVDRIVELLVIYTDEWLRTSFDKDMPIPSNSIQSKKYQYHNGGSQFYSLLGEETLEAGLLSNDVSKENDSNSNFDELKEVGVLEVAYLCLSLGFKGKYCDNEEEIERVKSNLAAQIGSVIQDNDYAIVTPLLKTSTGVWGTVSRDISNKEEKASLHLTQDSNALGSDNLRIEGNNYPIEKCGKDSLPISADRSTRYA